MAESLPDSSMARDAALEFIRHHRSGSLWFVRDGHEPASTDELIRAIRRIERTGSRKAYVEARRLREWLSRDSSAESAGS